MTDLSLNRRWVLAGGLWVAAAGPSFAQAAPVVETTSGKVRGSTKDGVLVFKGVPYGEDTSGANRFMPPKKKAPWTGVRDALAYGPTAPQGGAAPNRPPAPAGAARHPSPIMPDRPDPTPPPVSEDCLVLNVWTPATTGKRAVMFWMHGGGFTTGSGSSVWYEGVNIAKKQDVVIVTINHRLNVFGYCDLSAYGDQYAASGNVGMLDCVAALQWVRDNIERFGGDPSRVLIHGESGGGRKTSMMMAFTPAQGLFHRAVVQSGSALRMDGRELAQAKAKRVLEALNIAPADVGKLREVPMADLRAAGAKASAGYGQFRPVVDGKLLPRHPFEPDAPQVSKHIPMIIGTNRTEASVFMGTDPAMDALDDAGLKAEIGKLVPAGEAEKVYALYKRLYPKSSNAEIAYMVSTDRGYFLDSTIQAERKAAQGGAGAYYYAFYRETPVQNGRYFVPHAEEIPFVFDTLGNAQRMVGPVTPEAQALADKMSATWANFAKTGKAEVPGGPAWPPYNARTRPTMIFDEGSKLRVENDPRGEQRRTMLAFGSQQDRQSELPAPGQRGGDEPA
ncbi:carboxylesterase/lipase family protein [Phenylobacterium sp.]|jgi:para-nitrobenzyl esterase|uniref:carboxylesterase/lipase family protein n=1 Tax=Phenylobacterium sp. TaxID=1871053 RepID=UPI002E30C230|nr:carboxylesterase family protein [Phenylobacterium sp.]HEX2561343.1 carboxylesterase family protein [Phenylobacterium sp.]